MKQRNLSTPSALTQIGTTLWLGLAISLALLILVNFIPSIAYGRRIFPGVSTAGVSLSGLKLNQATALITTTPGYPETGKITLVYGDRSWVIKPNELGVFLDPQATAMTAYKTGRSGSVDRILLDRINLVRGGVEIPPSFIYNEKITVEYLNTIAGEINQPLRWC